MQNADCIGKKLLIMVLLSPVFCAATLASPLSHLDLANRYMRAKRRDLALEQYNQAISEDPNLVEAYLGRIQSYRDAGMEGKTLADCNKVISLAAKKYPNAYYLRALAERQLDIPTNVVADCNTALAIGLKNEDLYHLRAGAYKELGELKKAFDDYNTLLQLHAHDRTKPDGLWAVYDGRGELYEGLGQPDKAVADFTTSIKLHPNQERSYVAAAKLHDRLGQPAKAVDDYSGFLKYFPQDSQAWAERGRFYLKIKKYQEAQSDLTKAIEMEPNAYPKLYEARAEAYTKLGKLDLAAKDRKEAKEILP
jgi:tetratricopeptide (TPR) repeat protein